MLMRCVSHLIFLIFVCVMANAQIADHKLSSAVSIQESRVSDALNKFSQQVRVPIGFEQDAAVVEKPINISFQSGTVRTFLDALVKANPNYTWVEQDGVVDVMPVHHPDSFLDVTVAKCDLIDLSSQNYNDVYMYNIYTKLTNTPEARHWSERTGISARYMLASSIFVPGKGTQQPQVVVTPHTLQNVSTRTYLNELMKLTKSYYWVYNLYGNGNQYFDMHMY